MIMKKIIDYVDKHNMLNAGDYVAAGVSGGADSVCLLFALLEIRKKIPISIHAVHVNHMIRKEAEDDAEYVRSLCEKLDIKFTLKECDVEAAAKKEGISTEEAGRNVRYGAFYGVLCEEGAANGKIAVAHNKNDCCETFLFNLFRGSSLKGLSGIAPVRGEVIRPLMCLERREIEEFLDKNGIKYCIDHTNLEDNYTRNKIRHHILSAAVNDVSPAAVAHISEACIKIGGAYSLISGIAADAYEKCVKKDDAGIHIDGAEYGALHPVIQGYVIMSALERAAESAKDIEAVHVGQIEALFEKQCGRRIYLPYQLCAVRNYSGVLLYRPCAEEDNTPPEHALTAAERESLLNNESVEIRLGGGKTLVLSIKNISNISNISNINNISNIKPEEIYEIINKNIPQKKYTKWFDYDKIENGLVIRTRKEGDYLTIDTPEAIIRKKTLKAYFTDKKIPAAERGRICLVADGSHILWITGERISSFYKVSSRTRRILELELKTLDDEMEDEDGRARKSLIE